MSVVAVGRLAVSVAPCTGAGTAGAGVDAGVLAVLGNAEVAQKVVPPAVAARLASLKARKEAGLVGRTAIVPLWLNRADHVRAHEGCHAAAGLWNQTVAWLRSEWEQGETPNKEDVRRFVTSLPSEARPFHAHTAQAIAYDLWDAVTTSRTNRSQGLKARAPWREKKYRPLSFTAGFGWRVTPRDGLPCLLGAAADGSCFRCRR